MHKLFKKMTWRSFVHRSAQWSMARNRHPMVVFVDPATANAKYHRRSSISHFAVQRVSPDLPVTHVALAKTETILSLQSKAASASRINRSFGSYTSIPALPDCSGAGSRFRGFRTTDHSIECAVLGRFLIRPLHRELSIWFRRHGTLPNYVAHLRGVTGRSAHQSQIDLP